MNQIWMTWAAAAVAAGLASHASAQPRPGAAAPAPAPSQPSGKGLYKVVDYDPFQTGKVACTWGETVIRFEKPVVQGAGPVEGVLFTFGFPDNVEGKVTGVWEAEDLVKLEGDPDNLATVEERLRFARGRPCTL